MAPHWTLALILMISAIMIASGSSQEYSCVYSEYNDSPPPPLVKCGPYHECRTRSMCPVRYQSLPFYSIEVPEVRYERCRDNLVCCGVEFMHNIYTRD